MNRTSLMVVSALLLAAIVAAGCTKADSGPKEQTGRKQAAQVCAAGDCAETKPAEVAAPAAQQADKVMVYYFHSTRRCKTCMGIQQTIEDAVRTNFANQTSAGILAYKEVNIEEPANKHFIEEYQVSFSTMVVASMKGDKTLKWENCGKVWDFADDQKKLADYVVDRIMNRLEGK